MKKLRSSTGSEVFDELLEGGVDCDTITTVYGPAGSGKTNFCLVCALSAIKEGKRVVFIDTEGNFSVARLSQLTEDYSSALKSFYFFKPVTFDEQKAAFDKLRTAVKESVGLIVVDSISMLYRLERGQKQEDVPAINKELGLQLSFLSEIARTKHIPVVVTNQVYANFEEKDGVRMVGGDILRYGSKCLIELQNLKGNKRKAILQKHRALPAGKEIIFSIEAKGLERAS